MWHSSLTRSGGIPSFAPSHAYDRLDPQPNSFRNLSNAPCAAERAAFVSAFPGVPSGRPSGCAPCVA